MLSYGLPLPLRLLDARVLTSSRATVIRKFALMDPSTLAQIIPATRRNRMLGCRPCKCWCRSGGSDANECLFSNGPQPVSRRHLQRRQRGASHGRFCERSLRHVQPALDPRPGPCRRAKWHAELGMDTESRLPAACPLDTVIDYAPLPVRWEQRGFNCLALQTGRRCARRKGYAPLCHDLLGYVINGRSRIYSIREAMTVSLRWHCHVNTHTTTAAIPRRRAAAIRFASWPGHATHSTPDVRRWSIFVKEINGHSTKLSAVGDNDFYEEAA